MIMSEGPGVAILKFLTFAKKGILYCKLCHVFILTIQPTNPIHIIANVANCCLRCYTDKKRRNGITHQLITPLLIDLF